MHFCCICYWKSQPVDPYTTPLAAEIPSSAFSILPCWGWKSLLASTLSPFGVNIENYEIETKYIRKFSWDIEFWPTAGYHEHHCGLCSDVRASIWVSHDGIWGMFSAYRLSPWPDTASGLHSARLKVFGSQSTRPGSLDGYVQLKSCAELWAMVP